MTLPRGWQRRALHLTFLVGLVAIAWYAVQLRWVRAEASVFELGTPAETWVIDDPDAAYHLRRVQVAMATGDVPGFDRMIAHPVGSAVPWPRFSDWALAMWCEARVGAVSTMGFSEQLEREVEATAARVPPVLGGLTAILVALAAAIYVRRVTPHPSVRSRGWVLAPVVAGLVAAWTYATVPLAIWYSDAGRIDHHVLVALLFAGNLVVMAQVFACGRFESDRTECEASALDATLGGLIGGLLAGLALLTWLASAIFVALCGVTFWLAATAVRADRAENARRAGALYFLTAAIVTLVPALTSSWNQSQPWSLVNLTAGVPMALVVAAGALFLPALLPRREAQPSLLTGGARLIAAVVPPAAALLAFVLLPGFADGIREGLAWAGRGNLFMDVVEESRPLVEVGGGSLWRGLLEDLGWAGLALPVLALWVGCNVSASFDRTRGGARPEARFHLLLNLIVFGYLAMEQRRFGNSLAVPLAAAAGMVAGLGVARFENGYTRKLRGKALAVLGIVLAVGLVFGGVRQARGLEATPDSALHDTRAWRAELTEGLRWMRDNTPSSGSVMIAEARHDYGVLSSWSMGHMIEYYAQRPAIATNFGSFVSEENFVGAARALVARTPAEFMARLAVLDAEYVVVTPRQAAELASQARMAGMTGPERGALFERTSRGKTFSAIAGETALWRLALDTPGAPASYPGLERVYASAARESMFGGNRGGPSGPVLSIWKVTDQP